MGRWMRCQSIAAVAFMWTACSEVLGLRDGKPPAKPCESDEQCGPREACTHGLCVSCSPGERGCDWLTPEVCDGDGSWKKDDRPCPAACNLGDCVPPPSCAYNPICAGVSCCESLVVAGGDFRLHFQDSTGADSAVYRTVSPFAMDHFEVTVGRFRNFLYSYDRDSLPPDGAGAHPHNPGSGWQEAWKENPALLPQHNESLVQLMAMCGQTFDPGDPQDLPIRCVTWYIAFAFCIWDGARLPTEAEWAFAASNGSEQRSYPWPDVKLGLPISQDLACYTDDEDRLVGPIAVGSRPHGAGAFGQEDLAGNVSEWAADFFWRQIDSGACHAGAPMNRSDTADCLELEPMPSKVLRGGAFSNWEKDLTNSSRSDGDPSVPMTTIGFRCVRDLLP
jgi:sulfatase modifying factor 1